MADGVDFAEALRRVTSRKPVVLVKGGVAAEGQRAAASHTGALASDDRVFDGICRQLGAFKQVVDVSGIVLAKMDSSARGGIVVALREEYGVPIKLVGTGEELDDLESFEPRAFVEGVFES